MKQEEEDPRVCVGSGEVKAGEMPSRVEDYEVLYTIGSGSYGRCRKIRRKHDGKVSKLHLFSTHRPLNP